MDDPVDALFKSEAKKYFPKPTPADVRLFNSIPNDFCLDVPYEVQKTQAGSGSACLRMLANFHKIEGAPGIHALESAEVNWKSFNHESLAEDFSRAALKAGLLPFIYYPGRFVLPKFKQGFKGADFIAKNFSVISPFDHHLMKAAILAAKAPLFARLHFATDEYAMSESMATILDTAGQAVLICGWNKEGFIVHDPWNTEKWGGFGGGSFRLITYERLTNEKPLVNCCAEQIEMFVPLKGFIRAWENAVFENRDMRVHFELAMPKLPSYFLGYIRWDYKLSISSAKSIQTTESSVSISYEEAATGSARGVFSINSGPKNGSHPLEVTAVASGTYPVFAWETSERAPQPFAISKTFKARLDVKRLDWLNKYARI